MRRFTARIDMPGIVVTEHTDPSLPASVGKGVVPYENIIVHRVSDEPREYAYTEARLTAAWLNERAAGYPVPIILRWHLNI